MWNYSYFFFYDLFLYPYISVCVTPVCRYPQRTDGSGKCPGAGITGSCESLYMSGGISSHNLWKNN